MFLVIFSLINSESYKLDTIANVVLGSEILITRMGYYVTSDQSHKAVCTYISLSGYFNLIDKLSSLLNLVSILAWLMIR